MASKKPKFKPDCGGIEIPKALTRKEFEDIKAGKKKIKNGKVVKKTGGK